MRTLSGEGCELTDVLLISTASVTVGMFTAAPQVFSASW
jgi:hypothetical protein